MINPDHTLAQALPEDWDFYSSEINDQLASYFINLGLVEIAPILEKSTLCWIELKMNQPREDGLSSSEEFDRLIELEDRLVPEITQQHAAIYVGRLTHNNHRIFYFYLDQQDIKASLHEIMHQFQDYQYQFGLRPDPEWSTYFDYLYPDEPSMQCLQNRRVVDNLERNGDSLTIARPVEHWIYFQHEKDLKLFIGAVKQLGFIVTEQSKTDDEDDAGYVLQISRMDYVDLANVNGYVLELWHLARQHHGNYDGWETQIIRN